MIVLIDDERNFRDTPAADVVVLRTSSDALTWLRQNTLPISQLWLDHDLGGDDTIIPVIHFLEEQYFLGSPVDIDTVFVHTANPVGAQQIMAALSHRYRTIRVPAIEYLIAH